MLQVGPCEAASGSTSRAAGSSSSCSSNSQGRCRSSRGRSSGSNSSQQAQQLAAAEDQEVLLPEELPEPPDLPLLPAAAEEEPLEAASGLLARGTWLVYLLSNSWGGRAKLLDAAVKVGGRVFTHITLGMLTARKGLSLEQKQLVPLRVALDYVSGGSSSSSWGPQAVTVPSNAHLLLWGVPLQHIPGRVSSMEVLPGYEVLYGDALGSRAITAALGEWG